MNNQTENYIVLKPISERFNRIAESITDDEIRCLIKDEMRTQIRKIDFSMTVNEIIESYLEDHSDDVLAMYKNGLQERLR